MSAWRATPEARCVKCESDNIYVRWHAEGPDCGWAKCDTHKPKPERLEHVCRTCGFKWTTEPADVALGYPDGSPRQENPTCPTCPHPERAHGPFGCTAMFCGCEKTRIGGVVTGACRPTPNLDAIISHALAPWVTPRELPIVINILREDLLAAGRIDGERYYEDRQISTREVLVVPLVADKDAP